MNGLEDGELLEYWESGAIGQRGRFAAGKKEGLRVPRGGRHRAQRVEFRADAP